MRRSCWPLLSWLPYILCVATGPRSWDWRETPLTFDEVVASLNEVVGEYVVIHVWEGPSVPLTAYGRLKEPVRDDRGRRRWPVGDHAAYLRLDDERFSGGSRSAMDGGDYWGITILQGDLKIAVTDDMNRA